ncbi:hypothetical protein IWQ62_004868 [Dispira parvispora]|uniref:Uncharacterized protein n=1 Tax=Dispira parvispora TaxID=1520584 RepID=A0A9W8AN91_9FUNG|nr:hypothetical protein IWQ62_004868 [Dispira parvispora]
MSVAEDLAALPMQIVTWATQELHYRPAEHILKTQGTNCLKPSDVDLLDAPPFVEIFTFLLNRIKAEDKVTTLRHRATLLLHYKVDELVQWWHQAQENKNDSPATHPVLLTKFQRIRELTTAVNHLRVVVAQRSEQSRNLCEQLSQDHRRLHEARRKVESERSRLYWKSQAEANLRRRIQRHKELALEWEQVTRRLHPLPPLNSLGNTLESFLGRVSDILSKELPKANKQATFANSSLVSTLQKDAETLGQSVNNDEVLAWFRQSLVKRRKHLDELQQLFRSQITDPIYNATRDPIVDFVAFLRTLCEYHITGHLDCSELNARIDRLTRQLRYVLARRNAVGDSAPTECMALDGDALLMSNKGHAHHYAQQVVLQNISRLTEAIHSLAPLRTLASDYAVAHRRAKAAQVLLNLKLRDLQTLITSARTLTGRVVDRVKAIQMVLLSDTTQYRHQCQTLEGVLLGCAQRESDLFNRLPLAHWHRLLTPEGGNLPWDNLVTQRAQSDSLYQQLADALQTIPACLAPEQFIRHVTAHLHSFHTMDIRQHLLELVDNVASRTIYQTTRELLTKPGTDQPIEDPVDKVEILVTLGKTRLAAAQVTHREPQLVRLRHILSLVEQSKQTHQRALQTATQHHQLVTGTLQNITLSSEQSYQQCFKRWEASTLQ